MNRHWVVNASPLIVLAKVSHISLLYGACEKLVIPSGVAQEIDQGPEDDLARSWLQSKGSSWIKKVDQVDPIITAWDLGLGESQVISWAYKNPGYEVILDDREARNCALSLGIPVRGTLGVILLAKKEGRLPQIKPLLDQLIEIGFRIDPKLLKAALQLASE